VLVEPKVSQTEIDAKPTSPRRSRLRSASEAKTPARRAHSDAGEWSAFGRLLAERRELLGLNRRQAARRAAITERAWKTLETGFGSTVGSVRILPSPTDDEFGRIADALEMSPEALLAHLPSRLSAAPSAADSLAARIALLPPGDRALVDDLVSRLLADRPGSQ
jgi:transcriptional regulator with XRE-family HTH domain